MIRCSTLRVKYFGACLWAGDSQQRRETLTNQVGACTEATGDNDLTILLQGFIDTFQ